MIKLNDYLEAVQWEVSEWSTYVWKCYGPDAKGIYSEDRPHFYSNAIFSPTLNCVVEVRVTDTKADRTYTWIHPDFVETQTQERERRHSSYFYGVEEETKTIYLDVEEDIMEKLTAIVAGNPYDTDVIMNVDLADDVFLVLAKEAHKQGITFNAYFVQMLTEMVKNTLESNTK